MQFLTFCLIGFQQSGLGKSLFIDTDFTTILILAIEPLVVAGICYAENSLIQKKILKQTLSINCHPMAIFCNYSLFTVWPF